MPSSFQNHIHNFRAIAIIGVVCAHSIQNFTWPEQDLTFRILDTTFNQSTIWFAFIAGFLFQHLLPKYKVAKYYYSKLKNVLIPYVIWSVPALVVALFIIHQDVPDSFYDKSRLEQIFVFMITGRHLAPFWYIPTISLIFLIAPFLEFIDLKRLPYIFLPGLIILSAYLGRDGLLTLFQLSGNFSSLSKAVYLLAPYMMGMAASHYHSKVLSVMEKIHLPVLVIALVSFYLELENYHEQHLYIYIFKMTTCFSLLYYLSRLDWLFGKRLSVVADLSFGLFFIHGFLLAGIKIAYLFIFHVETLPSGNFWVYAAFCFLVIFLCISMLVLAKRFLGRNSRWIIGC